VHKIGIIGLLAAGLTACGTYYNSAGENKYLQSRNGPNLTVPPPLSRDNLSPFYNLPDQTQDPNVNIEPPQD
jgi:uncharacterized lipoprotein